MLREQLFIELLVSLLALSFPKVDYLNDIKKYEEQRNRRLNQQADSRFAELNKISSSKQPAISSHKRTDWSDSSISCVRVGDSRGVRGEEEACSDVHL